MEGADIDRRIALERAEAARQALEKAIKTIEALGGNQLYRAAWKKAIRALLGLK
jgi:hypothetical protein